MPAGDRSHGQPHVAFAGPLQRGRQHIGQHDRIVEGVVRPPLRHTPVRRQSLQPQVVGAQFQPAGQLHRAHDAIDRQRDTGQLGLRGQEAVVEGNVVRDQRAPAHELDDVADDLAELRLILEHLGGQPVNVGGTGIHARIEQAHHGLLDVPLGVECEHRQADDASAARPEAGGLDVDDGPTRIGLSGRPTPGHRGRSVPHECRISRRADIAGSLRFVSPT